MPRPDSLIITILLTGLVAFGPLSTDLYLPSLPLLGEQLGASENQVQLTLSVFMIGFAVSQLIYGPLSDKYGRRPVILGGAILFALSSVACAMATSIEALIVARFFQAVGACCGTVLGRAVVRDVYGRERAASVLSYMAMAMALAPATGPILGGYLTEYLGWQSNFWAIAIFSAAMAVLVATLLSETNQWRDPTAMRPEMLIRGYRALLGHRDYVGYLLVVALIYSGIFAFISGSAFLLIDSVGLTPIAYGYCFGAGVAGYILGAFIAGRISTRIGVDGMVMRGTATASVGGLVMLAFVLLARTDAIPLASQIFVFGIVGSFFLFMVGAGLTLSNALAGSIGPFPTMAGRAAALVGFCQMVVAALAGIAVSEFADGTGMSMALVTVLVTLSAMTVFLTIVRPHTRRHLNEHQRRV